MHGQPWFDIMFYFILSMDSKMATVDQRIKRQSASPSALLTVTETESRIYSIVTKGTMCDQYIEISSSWMYIFALMLPISNVAFCHLRKLIVFQ